MISDKDTTFILSDESFFLSRLQLRATPYASVLSPPAPCHSRAASSEEPLSPNRVVGGREGATQLGTWESGGKELSTFASFFRSLLSSAL